MPFWVGCGFGHLSLLAARPERGRACRLRRSGTPAPRGAAPPWFRAALRRAAPKKNTRLRGLVRAASAFAMAASPFVAYFLVAFSCAPVEELFPVVWLARGRCSLCALSRLGGLRSARRGGFAAGACRRRVRVAGSSSSYGLAPPASRGAPPSRKAAAAAPPPLRFASGLGDLLLGFLGGACRSCQGLLLALGIKCLCGFAASLSLFLVLLRVWLGDLFAPHRSACRALRHLGFGFICCLGGRVPSIFPICVSQNILKSLHSGARCVSLSTAKYCGGKFDTTVCGSVWTYSGPTLDLLWTYSGKKKFVSSKKVSIFASDY